MKSDAVAERLVPITVRASESTKLTIEEWLLARKRAGERGVSMQSLLADFVLAAAKAVESGKDPRLIVGRRDDHRSTSAASIVTTTRRKIGIRRRGTHGKR